MSLDANGETIELLTWRHVRAWGAVAFTDDELEAMPMIGWVLRNAYGRMVAIGGIVWRGGRAFGMFDMRPSYRAAITLGRSLRVQRLTRQVLAAALAVEPAVYAWIDFDIPRSEAWARRLGFRPCGDIEGLWVRGVVSDGPQDRVGGEHGDDGGGYDCAGQRGGRAGQDDAGPSPGASRAAA